VLLSFFVGDTHAFLPFCNIVFDTPWLFPYAFHCIVSWTLQFCPGSFPGIFSLWPPLSLGTFLGTWLWLYFSERVGCQGFATFVLVCLPLFVFIFWATVVGSWVS